MSFSDDDVKRLKEELDIPCIDPDAPVLLSPKKGKALIARLKAAEAYAGVNRKIGEPVPSEVERILLFKAWCKAAGRKA